MRYTTTPSPLGEVLLGFDDAALLGLWFRGQKDEPTVGEGWVRDGAHPVGVDAAARVARYFDGVEEPFDLPIRLRGTPFQVAVWEALRAIPRGETIAYAELARHVGTPAAVRAVGAAVGRNPVSIFVPCHRVVGSAGALTGYAGGLPRKTYLLRLEGALGVDGRVRRRTSDGAQAPLSFEPRA
ncbi:MAG: methylated-DNA--[protein]-cysteine S-methyltransferase [Burkholderiales bacterium]